MAEASRPSLESRLSARAERAESPSSRLVARAERHMGGDLPALAMAGRLARSASRWEGMAMRRLAGGSVNRRVARREGWRVVSPSPVWTFGFEPSYVQAQPPWMERAEPAPAQPVARREARPWIPATVIHGWGAFAGVPGSATVARTRAGVRSISSGVAPPEMVVAALPQAARSSAADSATAPPRGFEADVPSPGLPSNIAATAGRPLSRTVAAVQRAAGGAATPFGSGTDLSAPLPREARSAAAAAAGGRPLARASARAWRDAAVPALRGAVARGSASDLAGPSSALLRAEAPAAPGRGFSAARAVARAPLVAPSLELPTAEAAFRLTRQAEGSAAGLFAGDVGTAIAERGAAGAQRATASAPAAIAPAVPRTAAARRTAAALAERSAAPAGTTAAEVGRAAALEHAFLPLAERSQAGLARRAASHVAAERPLARAAAAAQAAAPNAGAASRAVARGAEGAAAAAGHGLRRSFAPAPELALAAPAAELLGTGLETPASAGLPVAGRGEARARVARQARAGAVPPALPAIARAAGRASGDTGPRALRQAAHGAPRLPLSLHSSALLLAAPPAEAAPAAGAAGAPSAAARPLTAARQAVASPPVRRRVFEPAAASAAAAAGQGPAARASRKGIPSESLGISAPPAGRSPAVRAASSAAPVPAAASETTAALTGAAGLRRVPTAVRRAIRGYAAAITGGGSLAMAASRAMDPAAATPAGAAARSPAARSVARSTAAPAPRAAFSRSLAAAASLDLPVAPPPAAIPVSAADSGSGLARSASPAARRSALPAASPAGTAGQLPPPADSSPLLARQASAAAREGAAGAGTRAVARAASPSSRALARSEAAEPALPGAEAPLSRATSGTPSARLLARFGAPGEARSGRSVARSLSVAEGLGTRASRSATRLGPAPELALAELPSATAPAASAASDALGSTGAPALRRRSASHAAAAAGAAASTASAAGAAGAGPTARRSAAPAARAPLGSSPVSRAFERAGLRSSAAPATAAEAPSRGGQVARRAERRWVGRDFAQARPLTWASLDTTLAAPPPGPAPSEPSASLESVGISRASARGATPRPAAATPAVSRSAARATGRPVATTAAIREAAPAAASAASTAAAPSARRQRVATSSVARAISRASAASQPAGAPSAPGAPGDLLARSPGFRTLAPASSPVAVYAGLPPIESIGRDSAEPARAATAHDPGTRPLTARRRPSARQASPGLASSARHAAGAGPGTRPGARPAALAAAPTASGSGAAAPRRAAALSRALARSPEHGSGIATRAALHGIDVLPQVSALDLGDPAASAKGSALARSAAATGSPEAGGAGLPAASLPAGATRSRRGPAPAASELPRRPASRRTQRVASRPARGPGLSDSAIARVSSLSGDQGLGKIEADGGRTLPVAAPNAARDASSAERPAARRRSPSRAARGASAPPAAAGSVFRSGEIERLVQREVADLTTISVPAPGCGTTNVTVHRDSKGAPIRRDGAPAAAPAGSGQGGAQGGAKDIEEFLRRVVRRILVDEQIHRERDLTPFD